MERNTSYLFRTDSLGNLKLISKKPDNNSGGWLIGIIFLVLIIAYAILISLILAPLIFTIFGLIIYRNGYGAADLSSTDVSRGLYSSNSTTAAASDGRRALRLTLTADTTLIDPRPRKPDRVVLPPPVVELSSGP